MPRDGGVERQVANLAMALLAVFFAVVGLVLLFVSGLTFLDEQRSWQVFLSQLGGLLTATGFVTFAWETFGRRAFAAELWSMAQLSADVKKAGLQRVTDQYLEDVHWSDLFRDVSKLDIVVAYASTWRNTYRSRLEQVAKRPDARIRVFLPDADDTQTVQVLAERFNFTEDELRVKIREAIKDFRELGARDGAAIQIYARAGDALFSCYRFDSRAVITMYSHSRERRTSVPTFVVAEGVLFSFVYGELKSLITQSKLIYGGADGHDHHGDSADA